MPKVSMPVNVFMVQYVCNVCQKGNLVATGEVLEAIPPAKPSLKHVCMGCGEVQMMQGEQYPRIEYAPIQPLPEGMETQEVITDEGR